jgi:hypothetical protein
VDTALNNCLDQAKAIASDPHISAFWQLSCHAMKKAGDDAIKAAADNVSFGLGFLIFFLGLALGLAIAGLLSAALN